MPNSEVIKLSRPTSAMPSTSDFKNIEEMYVQKTHATFMMELLTVSIRRCLSLQTLTSCIARSFRFSLKLHRQELGLILATSSVSYAKTLTHIKGVQLNE